MKPLASLFPFNGEIFFFILNWQSDYNVKTDSPELIVFAPTLETWYEQHRRDLPWRNTTDPYRIWLSEVILQQTRVAQGLPYYLRFTETYPTLPDLARADERELLRLWQGLGYYSRARNLHQTAKFIANTLNGHFPTTYHDLLDLKGIGTYTAAAVASFAFGERVPVVDGNVYRVLARVFGIEEDITTSQAKKTFAALAIRLMAHAIDPATYNQSIMEFGAIQCTPVAPNCLFCPLQQQCRAYLTGRQQLLPVKKKKAPVRDRYLTYFVFRKGAGEAMQLALRERTGRDVWQNLYEFYGTETDEPASDWRSVDVPDEVNELVMQGVLVGPAIAEQQLLSHQRIRAVFYEISIPETSNVVLPKDLNWYFMDQVRRLPKPVLIATFVEKQFG
ncbi:A/G-specific adenine glycosylase [Fibrella forsythiae]|uniref:A/G-specific adenine glycosylase n=1 Tax=Fibrella forsythiae TaxID=2817061 RepID=A0ABS3JNQ8_9BACT|nr:A/G-specific adenine glycosylase [Fibrella forsythiae]MBO0951636.1 A/G-specific adenine glycosylase [Fibrella forsythiae]